MNYRKPKYDVALFDLDGTLSESALGIRHSLEYALEKVGAPEVDLDDYSIYIGPPLVKTLSGHCNLPDDKVKEAFDIYFERYATKGKYENRLFDGIDKIVTELRRSGVKVAVCTSKCEEAAIDVMNTIGATSLFDAVCGSTIDGTRKNKEDIIPYAVETLGAKMTDKIVMIGDTFYDASGAEKTGVDFIGVLYGYGKKESMQQYGAKVFADTPDDLRKYLYY